MLDMVVKKIDPTHGFERLWRAATDLMLQRCALEQVDPAEAQQAFLDIILNAPEKRTIRRISYADDKFFQALMFGLYEIVSSYQCCEDIVQYLRRHPRGLNGITKLRNLRFIIEAYLQEMYILRERLDRFPGNLRSAAKKGSEVHVILKKLIRELRQIVDSHLRGIIGLRCQHVHSCRFSDGELSALSTLEFLVNKASVPLEGMYEVRFIRLRKKWQNSVRNNNQVIQTLLDGYAELIYSAVFTKAGKLRGVL